MKRIFTLVAVILSLLVAGLSPVMAQRVAINTDGSLPHASAILDVKSNIKGILIPRTSSTSRIAIVNPAKGLMIYDTTTSSFWFHNGSAWTQIAAAANGWLLTGNADSDPDNNFIGTTDNNPLRFKINNTWAGEIHPTSDNIFLGMGAGEFNTTAGKNIAIGTGALQGQSFDFGGETNNVAIGFEALTSNNPTSTGNGISNTAVGSFALRANTIGLDNTAIGTSALYYNDVGIRNTAIGRQALFSNTSGHENTATGYKALRANQDGSSNTANGAYSLYSNTYGFDNTAQGIHSLYLNSTGYHNSANGAYSLYSNTSGYANTASGYSALAGNTSASGNTAIGVSALEFQSFSNGSLPWKSNNVAVGFKALNNNSPTSTTNGINNTAVGTSALEGNTTGKSNTANGFESLFTNTYGSYNTANGYHSLYANTYGSDNTASGSYSLYSNTTGYNNTAIGEGALYTNNTGYDNTAIGDEALYSNTTGFFNTANGSFALFSSTTGAYNIALGDFALQYNTSGTGNIGIGQGSGPSSATYGNINNTVTIGHNQPNNQSNQAVIGNTSTQYVGGYVNWTNYLSDARFKKNIQENVKGLDFILQLRPVTYNLDIHGLNKRLGVDDLLKANHSLKAKDGIDLKQAESDKIFEESIAQKESITYNGFIAQEVEQAAKKVNYNFSGVKKPQNENDNYGLAYSDFVVPLVKAVQEQQSIIEEQNKKIEFLLKEMQLIKEQLNKVIDKSK